jgi:hypothetical protein
MHSGEVESFGVPVSIEGFEAPVSPENLDVYALERWDVSYFSTLACLWILTIITDHTSFHGVFWVGASIGQTIRGCIVPPRTQWSYEERVRDRGLPVRIADRLRQGRRRITSEGFQFLLQSPHTQLWEFMLSYLRMMAVCFVPSYPEC